MLSLIGGEPPAVLNQPFGAQCISLSRGTGAFQYADRFDTAVRFKAGGRHGAKLKEAVCTGVVKHLADEADRQGGYKLHLMERGGTGRRAGRPRAARLVQAESAAPRADLPSPV